jgi:hypothetical protein
MPMTAHQKLLIFEATVRFGGAVACLLAESMDESERIGAPFRALGKTFPSNTDALTRAHLKTYMAATARMVLDLLDGMK